VALCHQIIRQQREIAELKARLNQNSSNFSKPPSSDPPSVKRAPQKTPSGKNRGGLRGHKPQRRDLVPPDKVAASFDIKPETCRCCGTALLDDDPEPLRHQVAELPPIEPVVTVICPRFLYQGL
jgi:transposase